MKTSSPFIYVLAALLATATAANFASDDPPNATHGHHHHDADAISDAGQPGKASAVSRTIQVKMLDTMRYEPSSISVKEGETIRFAVVNLGKLRHEFSIGTHQEQLEHDEMMKAMPDMIHDDPNAVTLEPGQTKRLVWQFSKAGSYEIGCHIPGHYEAGMVSKVIVSKRK